MIKNFNTYNESLRDKLKGKTEEEINNALNNISPEQQLEYGCKNKLLWLVKKAFENGVDINKDIWEGNTVGNNALSYATVYGYYWIVRYLIKMGCKVTRDILGSVREHNYGHNDKMEKLLEDTIEKQNMNNDN